MVMDIDTAGGAATGGLIAGAIEKPTGQAGEVHSGTCSDCGHAVEGRFCSNCGQPTHVHRSLLHLGEELLHGVMHFDARIWRTLPLLALNPGRLTREWVQGKRTRYVSPLAMFLFTVFLMFFTFSFAGGLEPAVQMAPLPERIADTRADLAEARTELAEAERAAAADPGSRALAMTVRGHSTAINALEGRLQALTDAQAGRARPDGLAPESWQAEIHDAVTDGNLKVNLGNETLNEGVKKKLLNPDLALYKIQQTLYKFAFLLVPLSIPFVWLLFLWRRGSTLYDHGVFVLYSLTAVSLLFMVTSLLGPVWSGFGVIGGLLVVFGLPVHMFAQLKGAYSLSWFSAAWRTVLLMVFSFIVMALFVILAILLGLTG